MGSLAGTECSLCSQEGRHMYRGKCGFQALDLGPKKSLKEVTQCRLCRGLGLVSGSLSARSTKS